MAREGSGAGPGAGRAGQHSMLCLHAALWAGALGIGAGPPSQLPPSTTLASITVPCHHHTCISQATARQMQGLSLGGGGAGGSDDDEELFRPKKAAGQEAGSGGGGIGAGVADALDAMDSSRVAVPPQVLAAWRDEGAAERLRNRFVTGEWWSWWWWLAAVVGGRAWCWQCQLPTAGEGLWSWGPAYVLQYRGRALTLLLPPTGPPPAGDWGEGEARAMARPEEGEEGADGGEEEEVYGEFEDLETGEPSALVVGGSDAAAAAASVPACRLPVVAAVPRHACQHDLDTPTHPPTQQTNQPQASGLRAAPTPRCVQRRRPLLQVQRRSSRRSGGPRKPPSTPSMTKASCLTRPGFCCGSGWQVCAMHQSVGNDTPYTPFPLLLPRRRRQGSAGCSSRGQAEAQAGRRGGRVDGGGWAECRH